MVWLRTNAWIGESESSESGWASAEGKSIKVGEAQSAVGRILLPDPPQCICQRYLMDIAGALQKKSVKSVGEFLVGDLGIH